MQESNTEKIFYGVDDIKGASEIIIVILFRSFFNVSASEILTFNILYSGLHLCICYKVEGEMDKLAMEEAGFRNCVSVPDGAPPSVSGKSLPSKEEVSVSLKLCRYCYAIDQFLSICSKNLHVLNPEMKRLPQSSFCYSCCD